MLFLQSDEIKLEIVYLNDMGEEVVAPHKKQAGIP